MKRLWLMMLFLVLSVSSAHAQNRGALTNTWASWYTVTTAETNIAWSFNSRDIWISNGDGTSNVCVNLRGGTTTGTDCVVAGSANVIQIDAGDSVYLSDFITNAISLIASGPSASPVSVVVTY